jgi:D-amino-acid dehydrogenase
VEAGLEAQVLAGSQVREFEASVAGDPAGAVYYPGDAHCDPYAFVQAVGRAAEDAGARVLTRVETLGFRTRNGTVEAVQTTSGELKAGTVVLAAGYGTRVIATPLQGRLRLAGTLELAGLDDSVSRARVDAIVKATRSGLAGLEGRRVLEVWRGLRPCSPDGLPIVGRSETRENVVLATGHAMMGLTLAPITGRLVAEEVVGEEPSHDLRPLRPGRFQPLLGRE